MDIPQEEAYEIAHVEFDGLCSQFALIMTIMYILSIELRWHSLSVSSLMKISSLTEDGKTLFAILSSYKQALHIIYYFYLNYFKHMQQESNNLNTIHTYLCA